jgi:hypothetical protein
MRISVDFIVFYITSFTIPSAERVVKSTLYNFTISFHLEGKYLYKIIFKNI